MIRRWLPFVAGAGIVIWVTALVMLALTAEGPQRFGELYLAILLINVAGVVALLVLIGSRLADFMRDWRKHVPGSRLRGRTLLMFGGLAIAPLLHGVHVLGAVPDARHRRLVPRRGTPGAHRRARPVARGARPAHARIPRPHARHRRSPRRPSRAAGLYFALDEELQRTRTPRS